MASAAEKEVDSAPLVHKFRQLGSPPASVATVGESETLTAEQDQVQQWWSQLRRECHA